MKPNSGRSNIFSENSSSPLVSQAGYGPVYTFVDIQYRRVD